MRIFPLLVLTAALGVTAGCGGGEQPASAPPADQPPVDTSTGSPAAPPAAGSTDAPTVVADGDYKTMDNGLKYAVLKPGTGAEATSGQPVTVHYTGWLKDGGAKFDSSVDRGEPFSFALGAGEVIPGWDQGVRGMRVGEKRQLVIPPALGYGDTGAPPAIPPNATLVFDVELLRAGS